METKSGINGAKLYEIVSSIPIGKVTTYGLLAKVSGIHNPRVVGILLHKNPDPARVPCHRVVNSQGKLAKNYAFGGERAQAEKLKAEGVKIINRRVILDKYQWIPDFISEGQ